MGGKVQKRNEYYQIIEFQIIFKPSSFKIPSCYKEICWKTLCTDLSQNEHRHARDEYHHIQSVRRDYPDYRVIR